MKNFGWDFWRVFLPFLVVLGIIMFFPLWFTQKSWLGFFQLSIDESTSWMGDTFGGILGPYIAIVAAGLTFMAFWVQYKANDEIRNQFKHERFETKFYELLKLHKENVSEVDIDGKYRGRKSFVWMYKEFRFIYRLCKSYHDLIDSDRKIAGKKLMEYDDRKITELAYIIFFFGVGEISDKGIEYFTGDFDNDLIKKVLDRLKAHQEHVAQLKKDEWTELEENLFEEPEKYILEVNFEPFDGHVSKLAHYFRHLYQAIKLATTDSILDNIDKSIEYKNRYEYVKLIRVQLSNHEQTLIYYNSFFTAGKIWWGDNTIEKKTVKNGVEYDLSYFLDYAMIKNLAYNLTDGIGPHPVREYFQRLLKRGYGVENESERVELKNRIDNDLLEWGVKDDFFNQLVSEHKKDSASV
ncbi:Putative phage abortive infection protein [Ekhidna lutea]|uniref:Putative phage abortive infection protein n=1 Tax=Ekhidna lutea TaxID=447679 RepID=A0A239LGH5_EKHLU|nr:putative phage abortive infection protein [Ekhidna lutea]SNT28614.1 Putative phage abortive infection protein [Ekhidna lutea]